MLQRHALGDRAEALLALLELDLRGLALADVGDRGQHRELAVDRDRARREQRPHRAAVGAAQAHLEAVDAAVAMQLLDQPPAIAGVDVGAADRVGLRPEAEVEGRARQLVGEQHLGLADPGDHDRQRDAVGDPAQQLLALLELDLGGLAAP